MVSERAKWALLVIGLAEYVDGATRLQKYAFLAFKRIRGLGTVGFYKDWQPSDFGPFSKDLAKDIDGLVKEELIIQKEGKYYDYKMAYFEPNIRNAYPVIDDMKKRYPSYAKAIKELVALYQRKKLAELLHDVYYLYPEYASQSKIKAQVGKQIYESDSWLNPEYDSSSE